MARIYRKGITALIWAVLWSPLVWGATWVGFEKYESGGGRIEQFEFDADSLSPLVENQALAVLRPISVTWRRYSTSQLSPIPETQEIIKSRVFCSGLGISTYYNQRVLVGKDGQPRMNLGPPLISASSSEPSAWAVWVSPDGKLIRGVCQAVFPGWVPEFLAGQEKECSEKTTGMCSPGNRDLASSISLLNYRMKQVIDACTVGSEVMDKGVFSRLAEDAITDVLAEVDRCHDRVCQMNAVYWMLSWLNKDLERAARGQKCEAIQQRIAMIERDKQTAKGMENVKVYLACAVSKTPVLDDGITTAESVATALHSACLGAFNAAAGLLLQSPGSRQFLESELRPKLIEIVLQHRAALRVPKKQAPRPEGGKRIQS